MADSRLDDLLTTTEMKRADTLTIAAGTSGFALMERAGAAVADACIDLADRGRDGPVAVLCGPGNNGGDGFVAARVLKARGYDVRVFLAGTRDTLTGDGTRAAAAWPDEIAPLSAFDPDATRLVVDALFGAGLSRALPPDVVALFARIDTTRVPVVAVDVPSGIDGTSGLERGGSLRADRTVTFFRAKPGHYLYPGAAQRGDLVVVDIGIPDAVLDEIAPQTCLNTPRLWLGGFPWPRSDGHKYERGHAVVVSGGASHTGAARLSARAALRSGAGLVTLASPPDAMLVNAAQLTAIMLRESDGPDGLAALLADPRKNAVVLGPGLGVGEATAAQVATALQRPHTPARDGTARACVLDADALTSYAGQADRLAALIAQTPGPVVVTPHDGEFARLFSAAAAITSATSKLDKVQRAAAYLGCVVLLKGADSVVGHPDGRCSVAAGHAPWLATAGSGDVLSGLIGGLLAQAMPPFEAASAAVWIHADAARQFGPGLIAEDLPEMIPPVLRELYANRGTAARSISG